MKFGNISKQVILYSYLFLSICGLVVLFWGRFDQPWLLLLASILMLLVFFACLFSGVAGTALIAAASISLLLLPQFQVVLILIAVYSGAAAVCCKYLATGSSELEICLSDKLLLLFSLMICISAGFSAWCYSTLEPASGAGYLNIQVSVWGETAEAMLGRIWVSALVYCAAGPLLLLTKSTFRSSVPVRIVRSTVTLLLTFMLIAGVFSASLMNNGGNAPRIMQRMAEWPTVDSLSMAYPVTGVGVGTYFANASNHSVEIARPMVPHESGPCVIGRLAAEAGLPATFVFLLALVLLICRQAALALDNTSSEEKRSLWKPAVFAVAVLAVLFGPFDFELVILILLLLALGINTRLEALPQARTGGVVEMGIAWAAIVIMLVMSFFTNAQLSPMSQWERLRWPVDSGFYPAESGSDYCWTGSKAARTLTADRRFLYIKWFAGDSQAADFRATVRFRWDGRLVDEVIAGSGGMQHTIVPVDPKGSRPRLLVIEADPCFVPDDFLGNGDERHLGIAILTLGFIDELPVESAGFWNWENDGENEFHWSRKVSYLQVPMGRPFSLALRAGHPDVAEAPVRVSFSINGTILRELAVNHGRWQELAFDPADLAADSLPLWHRTLIPEATGILRIDVDRTWTPSDYSDNDDDRELGVAISRISDAGSPR